MKQTLIKITDDHYVVVDDSEIKEGDWCLYANKFGGKFICQAYVYERTLMFDDGSFKRSLGEGITPQKDECKKITHSTVPKGMMLIEGIKRLSLQEVKELIGEVDKFELFLDREVELGLLPKNIIERIKWYYQTYFKEDKKEKKYTEEIFDTAIQVVGSDKVTTIRGFLLKHIQPKTEWEVEFNENGKLRLV